jgi:hypothetical protein
VDCTAAASFASIIYDGEEAPFEAVQHFMTCASCRARLQDYARITSEMRILAAENQSLNPGKIPRLPPRSGWRRTWSKSVRVPRVAAVVFVFALAAATAGWVHTAAQNKENLAFWYDTKLESGAVRGSSGSRVEIGDPPDISTLFSGDQGFASRVEALSIHDHAVVLRVQFKYFSRRVDPDQVEKELEKVAPREITYVPGQQLSIPVEGGGPVLLSGHIVRDKDQSEPVGALALLPEPDEIVLSSPLLIRDESEILAMGSAGVHCKSKEPPCAGVFMYVPRHGLFFFSLHPLDNSIEGISGMSQLQFEEDGHRYLLISVLPLTRGDYPRKIWILHLKDYLPSQHGFGSKSDDMTEVGMGGVPTNPGPRVREGNAPNH